MRESPLTIEIPMAHSLPSHTTKGGLATPVTALPGYFNLDKDASYQFKNEKDVPQPQAQPQQQHNQPQQQLPSPAPSPVMRDYFFNGANKELNNDSSKRMSEYEYPSPVKGESPYQSYLTHPFTMQRQQKRQQELMRAQSITHRAQPQRSSLYLNNKYNSYVNSSQNQHVHLICASTKKTSVNSSNSISTTAPATPTGTSPRSIVSSMYTDMPTTTSALSMIEQENRMSVGSIDYYAREGRQEFYQAVHVFDQGHSIRSDDLVNSLNSRRQSMTPSLTSPPPPPYLSSDHGVAFHNHSYIDHKSSPSESSFSGSMRPQSPTTPLPAGMTTPGHRGSVQGWPSAMAMSLATAAPVTRPKQARTLPPHVVTISSSPPAINSPMSASGVYHPNKIFTPVTPDTATTPGFTPRASRLMDRGDTDTLYSFQLSDAEGGSSSSAKAGGPQPRAKGHIKNGSNTLGSAAQAAAEANSASAAPYFPGFWEDARQQRLHWVTLTAGCALVASTAWIVAMPAILAVTSFGIVGVPLAMLLLLSVQFSTHRWRRYRHRKLNSKKRSAVAVHAHAAAAAALMPSSPTSSTRTIRSSWSPRPSSLSSVTSLNEPLPASVHQSSPKIRPTSFLEPHQPSGPQSHQHFQPRLSQQMLLKHQRELNDHHQQVNDSGFQIERSRTVSQQESSSSSMYAASVGSFSSTSLPSELVNITLSADHSSDAAPAPLPLRLQIPSAVYYAQKKEAVELPDLGIGSLVGDLMAEFTMDINGIY